MGVCHRTAVITQHSASGRQRVGLMGSVGRMVTVGMKEGVEMPTRSSSSDM